MKAVYRAFLGHVDERPVDYIDERERYRTSFTLINDHRFAMIHAGFGFESDRSMEMDSVRMDAFGRNAQICVLNMLPGMKFVVEGRFKNESFIVSKISYA